MYRPLHITLSALALTLTTAACSDCGGSKSTTDQRTADDRVAAYADALPEQTTAAILVGDLARLNDGASALRDQLDAMLPAADTLVRKTRRIVGVDLFESAGWRGAGLSEQGGLAVALVDDHPVLLAHVTDRQSFERRLRQQAERHYDIGGSVRRSSVGDLPMKVIRRRGAQIAWTYHDGLAAVVFPDAEVSAMTAPTVTNTLSDLPLVAGGATLADRSGFRTFREQSADGPNFAYAAPGLVSRRMVASDRPGAPLLGRWMLQSALAELTAATMRAEVEDGGVRTTTWFGAGERLGQLLEAAERKAPESPWEGFVDDETLLAARLSIAPGDLFEHLLETLPEAHSRDLRRRLNRFGDRTGLDPRGDVIDEWTGEAIVVVDGLSRGLAVSLATGGTLEGLAGLRAAAGLQFDSADAADKVRRFLERTEPGASYLGAPLQYATDDGRLLVATEGTDLGELTGGEGGADADTETDGPSPDRRVLEKPGLLGLHLNGAALARRFDNRLPPGSLPARVLDDLLGVGLRVDGNEKGVEIRKTIQWRQSR
jgi:hypothetical protein